MAEQRLSRKEIRQPDPFVALSVRTIDWLRERTHFLLYGAVGALVMAALVTGWSVWQQHREQRAEMLLHEATKQLHGSPQTANRSQALEPLQQLVRDYRRTPAAAFAFWYLGHLHFEGGDYAAALTAYKQAQQRFSQASQPLMLALVTLDVGYAQEASGACDHAVPSFEAVLQLPAQWLRGEAYMGLGRCYEHAGALQQAVTVYERALSDGDLLETTRQTIAEQLALVQLRAKEQG